MTGGLDSASDPDWRVESSDWDPVGMVASSSKKRDAEASPEGGRKRSSGGGGSPANNGRSPNTSCQVGRAVGLL